MVMWAVTGLDRKYSLGVRSVEKWDSILAGMIRHV